MKSTVRENASLRQCLAKLSQIQAENGRHEINATEPMAVVLAGASRAVVQRDLTVMEKRGLIREVTGQGRFRMWRAI